YQTKHGGKRSPKARLVRENGYGSRKTMVGATGIEPAAPTMSKKRGDATSANASFGADDDIRTPALMGACDPSRTRLAVRTASAIRDIVEVGRHRATLNRPGGSARTPEAWPRAGRPRSSPSFVAGWPSRLRRCRWSSTRPGL